MVEDDFSHEGNIVLESELRTEKDQVDALRAKIDNLGFVETKQSDKLKMAFALVDRGATKDGVRNRRKDETLEIVHPVEVAVKVKEIVGRHRDKFMGNGAKDPAFEVVLAGLLHDYIEDVEGAKNYVGAVFGGDIGMQIRVEGWVMDVTKQEMLPRKVDDGASISAGRIGELVGSDGDFVDEGEQKEVRKILEDNASFAHIIEMAENGDFVPLVIKTADRLHNLETIGGLKPKRQIEVVEQTREKIIPALLKYGFTKEAEEVKELCDKIVKPVATSK